MGYVLKSDEMTDNEICELANRVFAGSPRPEHFTNYTHCSECEEHDDLLRSRNLDTLQVDDIDNPGWDAICYLTPDGWLYYFPAFVRLSFSDLENSYISQFLFHLSYAENDKSFSLFNRQKRQAVVALLHYIREHHMAIVQESLDEELLEQAIKIWESKH